MKTTMQDKNQNPTKPEQASRRPYSKPCLRMIELTIEETLADACKTGAESECITGPTAFDPGT